MEKDKGIIIICLAAAASLLAAWVDSLPEARPLLQQMRVASAGVRPDASQARLSPSAAKRVIADRARKTLLALKSKNMSRLSAFVHPEKGVRFSPYAHVSPGEDRVFQRKQVRKLWSDKRSYLWGSYDGSGDPIRLTFKAYYQRFIYDRNYSQSKRIGYNDALIGRGNTLNNIREIYPEGIIVEYHMPGTNPDYGGMDWRSLWLVFEKSGASWYLTGVVHDEWTI